MVYHREASCIILDSSTGSITPKFSYAIPNFLCLAKSAKFENWSLGVAPPEVEVGEPIIGSPSTIGGFNIHVQGTCIVYIYIYIKTPELLILLKSFQLLYRA